MLQCQSNYLQFKSLTTASFMESREILLLHKGSNLVFKLWKENISSWNINIFMLKVSFLNVPKYLI